MHVRTLHAAAAIVVTAGLLGVGARTAVADPETGERLAQRWCAACHLVAPDQRQASADVAPFATIARMPGFNAEKLAFFLLHPHPKMPDLPLTRREAADIADYIARLGSKP